MEKLASFQPHPLLIPSIVSNILSYSSMNELKRFRLVCGTWDDECIRILRGKTQIRFATEEQLIKYLNQVNNRACSSFEFSKGLALKTPAVTQFYSKYGDQVKSLKLHNSEWNGAQLHDILFNKLKNLTEISVNIIIPKYGHFFPENKITTLPNLKILKLNFTVEQRDFYYFSNPTILRELFLALPNLEQIHCPNWPIIIEPTTVANLVFNVIFSDANIKFDKLSHLYINASFNNNNDFEQMTKKKFPLKDLRLELQPNVSSYFLFELLITLRKTLTSLTLSFFYYFHTQNFIDFPILVNVRYLCLHRFEGTLNIVSNIVQCLPELKCLVLNDVSFVWNTNDIIEENNEDEVNDIEQREERAVNKSAHQLEELCVEETNSSSIIHTKKLFQLFPNLKKLRMQKVCDAVLRIIYENLPLLEELVVEGYFSDEGITGIQASVCKRIMDDELLFIDLDPDTMRVFPYIGQMTKLRKVQIDSDMMTYLSIVYGTSRCKSLVEQRITSNKILHW